MRLMFGAFATKIAATKHNTITITLQWPLRLIFLKPVLDFSSLCQSVHSVLHSNVYYSVNLSVYI